MTKGKYRRKKQHAQQQANASSAGTIVVEKTEASEDKAEATAKSTSKTPKNKNPSRLQRFTEWAKREKTFTDWCIAAFTLVLACAAIYQFIIMGGQLDLTKQQFEISHRPWVNVAEPVVIIKPLTFDGAGASVTVQVGTKNGGTAPALQTVVLWRLMVGTPQLPDIIQEKAKQFCDAKVVKRFTGRIGIPLLLPGDLSPPQLPQVLELARQEFEIDKRFEKVSVNLLGCIGYEDERGKPHGTAFVRGYVLPNGDLTFSDTGVVQGEFRAAALGFAY